MIISSCSLDTSNLMNGESRVFPVLLNVGDAVAISEGLDESTLSTVSSVTGKHIQVEAYPGLKFDRETGDEVPKKKCDRTYRYLYSADELQLEREEKMHKAHLLRIINESNIPKEKYEQCVNALEQILGR